MDLSVDDLKESNAFLNDLYASVTTAIFLADEDARLTHFNDAFKALFYKPEDELLGELCGNAMGCSFVADEGLDCGSTSNCERCELRSCIIRSFIEHVPVFKMPLVRDFDIRGGRVRKHFSFTTKYASYLGQEYVLVLVDDVTDIAEARVALARRNKALEATVRALTRELTESSIELMVQKTSSERLGRELRHRVGNTLQILSSLLQFYWGCDDGEPKAFRDFSLRVDAIAEAYKHTKYDEGSVTIPLRGFLRSLVAKFDGCGYVEDGFEGNEQASLDMAVPLGLAVVELLCLAQREAGAAGSAACDGTGSIDAARGRGSVAAVSASATPAAAIVSLGRDDGVATIGVAARARCFDPRDASAGVGLARALVEQIKGDLEVTEGRTARIRLPL